VYVPSSDDNDQEKRQGQKEKVACCLTPETWVIGEASPLVVMVRCIITKRKRPTSRCVAAVLPGTLDKYSILNSRYLVEW